MHPTRISVGWMVGAGFASGVALLVFQASSPTIAQHQPTARACERGVDATIKTEMERVGTPGMMVSVYQNGKALLEKGYGRSSIPNGPIPDANTIFTIGSLSKVLTGVGALALAGQDKLDLEAPISRYLPQVPRGWRNILVNRFLSHSSGIPNMDAIKEDGFDATLRAAAKLPLAFPPGTSTQYNNFNFAVIGQVIAAQSKQSYIDFMNRQVFMALRMDATGLVKKSKRAAAVGYTINAQGNLNAVDDSHWLSDGPDAYGIASGGLQSNAADLQRLALALETQSFLHAPQTRALLTPVPVQKTGRKEPAQYTSAGFVYDDVSGLAVLHKTGGGSGVGTGAVMMLVPDRGISVVLLRNAFAKGRQTSNGVLAAHVLESCFDIKVPVGDDEGD